VKILEHTIKIKVADRRDKPAVLSACKKVCYIPLNHGKFAVIDPEDYFRVCRYNWRCRLDGNTYYANTSRRIKGRMKIIFMHRLILKAPKHKLVDHIDGNGLNNRKANLRLCNYTQNAWNRRPAAGGHSKYKGVTWHNNSKGWYVRICKDYKNIYIGCFDNEIEAALAYDRKAKKLFGEFAYLNFPESARENSKKIIINTIH